MNKIYLIDSIHLDKEGVHVKSKNGKLQKIHIRQGDLDGACAVYSTFMILIILGVVKFNDIRINGNQYDKRFGIERLKKTFFELKGLHRDGNYYYDLDEEDDIKRMLERSFKKYINVDHINNRDFEAVKSINEILLENIPVLISIAFKSGGSHSLVAIGMEHDEKDNPTKILCLDPGYPTPTFTYWNSVIKLNPKNSGKYKFQNITENGSCEDVQLLDSLKITKK